MKVAPLLFPVALLVFLSLFISEHHVSATKVAGGSRSNRGQGLCVFPGGFYSYDTVMECFKAVPWNETVKQTTLTALAKAMQLYVFLDIATNPPNIDRFYPPVDLLSQFERIRNTWYDTDYDFHLAIRNVFLQLHDAHTNYYAPACYASFTFYQPFSMISYIGSSSQQVIGVSAFFNNDVYNYYLNNGLDLKDYVGATVLAINGENALTHIRRFANFSVGSAKDPSTRFNIALGLPTPFNAAYTGEQWLGLFSARPSHFIPAPSNGSVHYLIQFPNGTVSHFTFPWIAQSSATYTGLDSFMQAYFNAPSNQVAPSAFAASKKTVAARRSSTDLSFSSQKIHVDVKKLERIYHQKQTADPQFKPIANTTTSGVGVYQLDNRTLVIYINTFLPDDYYAFQSTIVEGMYYANFYGLDRLILDLTLNGGGDICLGRSMLRFLFPEGPNFGPTDMPSSPLARNLTRTAALNGINETEWSPAFYQRQNQTYWNNNDTSWLIPGIPHVRGGLLRNYSQLIHIASDIDGCGNFPIEDRKPFDPKKTLMITHGFCGSTCALFANHIQQYYGVKTITVGGIQGVKQQYTSFPGLEVLETPGFYDLLDSLLQNTGDQSCTSCLAPRRLGTSGGFRMCIREIYGPINNFNLPLEYTWQPSDYHIDNTPLTADHPEYVWPLAAAFFSS